ncbi:mitochondrial ribosomal protein subunit L20-domain-containing protein [Bisporella sp. PMI_857]|nr:mitochondrial ribosomal protein subunit L20-domain-containing protein [Bisporella sp. PMI_857]
MEARLLRMPLGTFLSSRINCLSPVNATTKRHESTYRRSKKRLNIKPDATFLSNSHSPQQDHIIFNPPSSAPSILHTPLKFLPKEDKRKQLFATAAAIQPKGRLPPIIPKYKPVGVRHHLTDADIAEIQRLRTQDPEKWTARKLANKYNTTTFFIAMCVTAPAEKRQRDAEKKAAVMARWGPKKTKAREERLKRIELALRDE